MTNQFIAFTPEQKEDVLILRIKGKLDAVSSSEIEREIFQYIETGNIKILLDLKDVPYISSPGLRMLLSVNKKLQTKSGKLILFAITQNVFEILSISGFDHILQHCETESEGMELIKENKK